VQVERYAAGLNLHEPVEEEWVVKLLQSLPPGRAVFVDVGAAVGYYCFLVAKHRPDAELHAYEPDPENHARIRENAALNGVTGIHIHGEAVGPQRGFAVLVGSGFTGFLAPPGTPGGRPVAMTTIDDIAAGLGTVQLLKMDIQGGEVMALMGAQRALQNRLVINWVVGTHSAQIHAMCLDLFRKHGYRILFEALKIEHQPDGLIVATVEPS
jgi:FkbM family methyltransferase